MAKSLETIDKGDTPFDSGVPLNETFPTRIEDGVPWAISRMDVLKRLHIQDQVLKYLKDKKSAQTQPIDTNPARMHCILPKVEIATYPSSTGTQLLTMSQFFLPQTAENDNPPESNLYCQQPWTTTKLILSQLYIMR